MGVLRPVGGELRVMGDFVVGSGVFGGIPGRLVGVGFAPANLRLRASLGGRTIREKVLGVEKEAGIW